MTDQKRKPGRPKADPDAEVIVKCVVGNIWTTRGKINRGETIMLPPDEADMIKGMMTERNQAKLEA
jgi:hypothetical protein